MYLSIESLQQRGEKLSEAAQLNFAGTFLSDKCTKGIKAQRGTGPLISFC